MIAIMIKMMRRVVMIKTFSRWINKPIKLYFYMCLSLNCKYSLDVHVFCVSQSQDSSISLLVLQYIENPKRPPDMNSSLFPLSLRPLLFQNMLQTFFGLFISLVKLLVEELRKYSLRICFG
jgi:hypothetical protein